MLLFDVEKFIVENELIPENLKVIVAFSGGPDSVALLNILNEIGYPCVAAHVNFHLRGAESDRDEKFAREMCSDLEIPFYKEDLYAAEYSKTNKISVEMAARELRYDWFERLRKELGAGCIAVAHHQDDSIETVFLNLLRGTGIHGVTGINAKNGYIVRPLLCCTRKDIIGYLADKDLSYVTDSTNLKKNYKRNKIRLDIMPMLESIQPSAKDSIYKTIGYLSGVEAIYNNAVKDSAKRVCKKDGDQLLISIPALKKEISPETVLFEVLSGYGFSSVDIEKIWKNIDGISGRIFYSKNFRLVFDREVMILDRRFLPGKGEFLIDSRTDNISEPFKMSFSVNVFNSKADISKEKKSATFDYDKLSFPLVLRHPKKGDRFIPFGMKGKKLISDFCIDLKMTAMEKENLWVLLSGKDIIWVVGYRVDNRYSVGKSTKKIYKTVL